MGKGSKAINELAASMRARAREERTRQAQRRAQAGSVVVNDDPARPLVNEFMKSHGDYVPAGEFGAARNAALNRGGTAVSRWTRDGLLSETQQAAIKHCERLWALTDTSSRMVANLDRTVFGCPGDGNMAEIEARADLHRIKDGFPFPLDRYFQVFENVCRFDEPAGVAGSRIANDKSSAASNARTIVCFVADIIATRERLSYLT